MQKSSITLLFALLAGMACLPSLSAQKPEKIRIENIDQLPRFEYPATGTAKEMITDAAKFAPLAKQFHADVEAVLAKYQIDDKPTLRDYHNYLMEMAIFDKNWASALEHIETIRALQDKPSDKLTSGLFVQAAVTAWRDGQSPAQRRDLFRTTYTRLVQDLPWDIVQDNIERAKGGWEIRSPAFYLGIAQESIDPAIAKTGSLSQDLAGAVVNFRFALEVLLPLKDEMVEVLAAYIKANRKEKPDIWAARNFDLNDAPNLSPVVIAIWDSGLDTAIFQNQLWANSAEIAANQKDDDNNGFVDDVHGIAFDLYNKKDVPLLFPMTPEQQAAYPQNKGFMKGWLDVQAALDTPEASALKKKMAIVQADEMKPLIEGLNLIGNYAHGTHVAGIAAAGNPAARLLATRITFDYKMIPEPPTLEDAVRGALTARETVDYFRKAGVRVVNMSWGGDQRDIEAALEANGIGDSPEHRAEMARIYFNISKEALTKAMASAPDILFVPAAGNSDSDIGFATDVPASIELPNVLAVGAVDQAGEETGFTSFGKNVKVHASGFEVDSYIPGGERMKFSGTSMAAPQVCNLAGKLLALQPSLTTEQLIMLIRLGCETSPDGRRHLLHPRRSLELLRTLQGQH